MDYPLSPFSRLRQTLHSVSHISILAAMLALYGCGGGTAPAPLPDSSNPRASPSSQIDTSNPSSDGPYGVQKAEGILVKFNNQVQSKAARSVFKAAGTEQVESFTLVDGLMLAQVAPGQTIDAAIEIGRAHV